MLQLRNARFLSALQLVIAIAMFPAFFCLVSFLAAKTPMQAATDGRPLPPGWAAGVWAHENYYHWWPIKDRPGLFALSVLTSVLGIAFLLWSVRRRHVK